MSWRIVMSFQDEEENGEFRVLGEQVLARVEGFDRELVRSFNAR